MCLAVPGKIVSVMEDDPPEVRRGKVDFSGVQKEICLAFTPEAAIGDYVLVHNISAAQGPLSPRSTRLPGAGTLPARSGGRW